MSRATLCLALSILTAACASSTPNRTTPPPSSRAESAPPSAPVSASSSGSAAPLALAPSVPIDTADWVPFTSDRYGYAVAYPPTWTFTPATRDFEIDQRSAAPQYEESDQFWGSSAFVLSFGGYWISFTAFAVDVPAGTSEDQWTANYYASRLPGIAPGSCAYADAEPRPISVDGHRGTMIVGDAVCGDSALIFIDGRAQVFELGASDRISPAQMPEWRTDKTDLLQALLGTVEFQP